MVLGLTVGQSSRQYVHISILYFFFFNATATTEIYTLSLHDALPIFHGDLFRKVAASDCGGDLRNRWRSEEHTSELQSRGHLVCRLLLEKKKKENIITSVPTNLSHSDRHPRHAALAPPAYIRSLTLLR